MTVAFDAVASASVSASGGSTLSWTHTPVGTPTAAGVSLWNYDPFATITGITYGGVAMTQAVIDANQGFSAQVWGLANPPSGAQTVVITFSGTGAYCMAGSVTVTGSDTTTCFRASSPTSTDGFDSAGASSLAVTTAAGDLVFDVLGIAAGYTFTAGGSQALRWGELAVNSGADSAAGSTLPASGSSTTMAWTYANSGATTAWAAAAASFQVGSGGGGGSAIASIATPRRVFLKPKRIFFQR